MSQNMTVDPQAMIDAKSEANIDKDTPNIQSLNYINLCIHPSINSSINLFLAWSQGGLVSISRSRPMTAGDMLLYHKAT